ncbi:hypothetical protein PN836_020270 [Ningiella sp. W23]|uniref:hypothetical protein n=1 Tax=Ningiella sp. W23 TaxID=3023715 RepID=UPI0037571F64
MSNLFIGVKRIVAVDSSEFAYAELEVDEHSMLVAQGNVGKSSLINAIRLFFLPECSLAKQAVNFGFSDSHGEFYSAEETFNHYFPSKYSFLILEYEKRVYDGPHCCQIISASQTGRLKIERMFTQLPFAQLRPLFWQEGDDADGIGQRVDSLSKQRIYDFIQKHDKRYEIAKEPNKVAAIIYESELQASRYTLFPLRERNTQTINSLRALIKLLFVASGKNKKPFTDAIANIIESAKKTSQDQLGFDIAQFKAQHESLKLQENQLNKIINEEKLYLKILKDREDFTAYLAMLGDVKPGLIWLQNGLDKLQQELSEHANKNGQAQSAFEIANKALTDLEGDLKSEKRKQRDISKDLKQFEQTTQTVARIKHEFPGQSVEFIQQSIQDDLDEKQHELDIVEGRVARDEAIASLETKLTQLCARRDKLRFAIDKNEFSLEAQLPKNQVDWLHSIHPALANANAGHELSEQERTVFEQFFSLFESHPSHFAFYDRRVEFKAFMRVNREAELEKLTQEIESVEKQLKEISGDAPSALHQEQSIKQLQQQILLNIKDLEALSNDDYAQRRVSELVKDADITNSSIEALEYSIAAALKKCETARAKRESIKAQYSQCKESIAQHSALLKQLKSFASTNNKWLVLLPDDQELSGYINENTLELFQTSASHLEQLQYALLSQLRSFIDANIIDDKHGIKGDAPFWHEISKCVDDVSEVYGNLDTQRSLLGRQIEEHNHTIGTKKEIIVQNFKIIKAFEKEINQAFAGITINNVESVEFEVGINKQFSSLVNEFAETNLYSNQMQSDDFYQRLVAFAERFFDKDDNFTLTMDRVIDSFEPRVQLKNKRGREDKKQSNSTNALIKIKLVQLLLKRLIAHNCDTSLPIVHDEIANIDIGQFDWWLNDLAESGFKLMAAGTHSTSAELQAKIGRRHVMDALTTALPYHAERNRVYWKGAETFTSLETGEQAELI